MTLGINSKLPNWMNLAFFAALLFSFTVSSPWASAQEKDEEKAAPQETESKIAKSDEGKFQFNFENEEWKNIIEYFAEEAGFSLQLRAENYPKGTWTYHSDEFYTIQDAIDTINQGLRVQNDPYTLLRFRSMMILIRERDGFPEELIETIASDLLDTRGKYETMRCVFDVSKLKNTEIVNEVRSLVDRNAVNYLAETGQLIVTSTGEKLRVIRTLIERMFILQNQGIKEIATYKLKNVPAEELLIIVRSLMGIRPNELQVADGSLIIQPQPLGDLIYLKGTKEKIEEFQSIANVVDVSQGGTDASPTDRPFLKVYPVEKDAELTMQVLQTVMQGKDVKLDQGKDTGSIIALARTEDHVSIQEVIDSINGSSNNIASIQVKNRLVDDAIEYLKTMFRQADTTATAPSTGPVFYGDVDADQLVVRGTPQEIAMSKELIEAWDKPDGFGRDTVRTGQIYVPMNNYEADQLMNLLGDTWPTTGRQNKLNIVMPDERDAFRRQRSGMMFENDSNLLDEMFGPDPDTRTNPPKKDKEPETKVEPKKSGGGSETKKERLPKNSSNDRVDGNQFVSFPSNQEPQKKEDVGQSSQEAVDETRSNSAYRPPVQQESKPGAPVTVKVTDGGIVIDSEDFDAAQDMEDLINSLLKQRSNGELPAVFYLKFARANEAKTMLDQLLGVSSGSGGGGGGGIGNIMSGMVQNAMGGAAGDLLGGLLGGGSSSAGSSSAPEWLEGSVTTYYHMRLNSLIVVGATSNDLQMITQFIDYLDQPQAPHDPNLVGETRVLVIRHFTDPAELKKIIETNLSDLIKTDSGGGAQGGDQAAAQQAQMMRAVQQMMGGGGRGGITARDPEEEKPKAKLSLSGRLLIVTGPEYIYNEVAAMVNTLDVPDPMGTASEPYLFQGSGTMNMGTLAEMLKAYYPGQIEIVGSSATPGTTGAGSPGGAGGGNSGIGGGQGQPTMGPTISLPANFPMFQGGGAGNRGTGGTGGRGGSNRGSGTGGRGGGTGGFGRGG